MTSAILDNFRRDYAPVVSIIEQAGAAVSVATEFKDPSTSGPRAILLVTPPHDPAFGLVVGRERVSLERQNAFRLEGSTEDSNAWFLLSLIERLGHSLAARGEHDRA